jgi:mRNA-degrading endonuclease HigB of HigAB toxin-antitoxin module
MNAKRMENHQTEETPKIKVVKEYAKKKAKKKLTLLDISKLIDRANKKGPDSLSPEELEIVNEYSWIEEIDGDAYHLLQEMLFHLEEGPAEGITPEDVVKKVSQKDAQDYRDARINLMRLIKDLQFDHDFEWKVEEADRSVKDGYHMSRATIAKVALMTTPRILQAEAGALMKMRKLPKEVLDEFYEGIEMFKRLGKQYDQNPGSEGTMKKGSASRSISQWRD